jgi:Transcriptional regulators
MAKQYATLSEQIYDDLFHDITDQKLVCGQKLTLKMLKERFNTSHTPIREALTRLSENGLVTYYSNCGVTVTTFTEGDIKEIFQFIGELDALSILFCKASYTQEPLIFELGNIIEKGDDLLEKGKIAEWKEFSEEFHTAFYNHADNSYLYDAAKKLHAKVEVLSSMYYIPQNVEKINADHKEIFQFIKGGDFEAAADKMRTHLQLDMVYALNAYKEYEEKNNITPSK